MRKLSRLLAHNLLFGLHLESLFTILPTPTTPSHSTMVLLVTSDNEQFTVEKEVAERSVLIKNMLEGG